ncbi:putative DNA-binding domain [Macleaya cordata]|uniref:KAT8 regulatory NSL complex subunit 2 n=1 Tax=Macleaya cordata TaxID=56857 RepID=A0A200Q2D8_MACCD|nr:putative DNA-binding domain [Macleaya cordata]
MGSVNKHHTSSLNKKDTVPHQSQIENPRNPSTSSDTEDRNPNPNNSYPNLVDQVMESGSVAKGPLIIDGTEEDSILAKSEYLTREEVIRRRLRRVKQMEKVYRDHYWALMEELRVKYREYYWKYGKSPFKEEEEIENVVGNGVVEGSGENNNNNNNNNNNSSSSRLGLGLGSGENSSSDGKNKRCASAGCKSKAMALTNYCHNHILLDTRQTLYKSCDYVVKSASTGPVHCGKTILRSNVPSLCSVHFQKAEKHVTRALRRAGLNITSSSKLAPKFHVIVAESVRQINAKRRERKAAVGNAVVKEENGA